MSFSAKWKIVIFSCIGIIFAIAFLDLFVPPNPDQPTLPDELLLQSQGMKLNAAEGEWEDRIANASRASDMQMQLAQIAREALAGKRLDAACTAARLISNDKERTELLKQVFEQACQNCGDLPWATLALQDMALDSNSEKLKAELAAKWQECKKSQATQ